LLWKLMNRPLVDLRVAVIMLDGIELPGRTNIVALGAAVRRSTDRRGSGRPSGSWTSSTSQTARSSSSLPSRSSWATRIPAPPRRSGKALRRL
jgi:hypothetical protein